MNPGDTLFSARAPVREPPARRAGLQASRPQRPLPDAVDHDSNRTWDGCAQLDVSPLTLHQAPWAIGARDHRGRAAVRRGCPARPAVCRPDRARRSLLAYGPHRGGCVRYRRKMAAVTSCWPLHRRIVTGTVGRTAARGPATCQYRCPDRPSGPLDQAVDPRRRRGYPACAALGLAPGDP
jgi:hypothetical protein